MTRLREVFRFELAYQVRRVWPWLFLAAVFTVGYMITGGGTLEEALREDFFVNSPFAIAKDTVVGMLVWLLAAVAIAGEAGARDVAIGMHPLVYTTPLRRAEYLGGRFAAALLINAVLALGVQAGIMAAVHVAGTHGASVGPFRPAAYLTAYAYIALPTVFCGTAMQFWFAVRTGRPMAGFLGSIILFFTGFFIASFLFFRRTTGSVIDPIGIRFIVDDLSHQWTTYEKSWRLLHLQGTVLANRMLWTGVGIVALAITYATFRFEHRAPRWKRRRRVIVDAPPVTRAPVPALPRDAHVSAFGARTRILQAAAVARESFKTVAAAWAGIAMLTLIPVLAVLVVIDQMQASGSPIIPTTPRVLRELTGSLSDELSRWVIIPMLCIFFIGELLWRERESRVAEITDAMPTPDWTRLAGKSLGVGGLLALLLLLLIGAGTASQEILGYHRHEPWLFARIMFGLQLPEYLLFIPLVVLIHVAVNQKYVGHLLAIVAYVYIALSSMFGIEHRMLVYSASPAWMYTPMRGFGASLAPWLWFKLYWASWAALMLVVARLLWVRGRETGMMQRIARARRRLRGGTLYAATVAVALIFMFGGFVFYNTNVLNRYYSSKDLAKRGAQYERLYGRFKGAVQPEIAAAALRVEIDPLVRAVDVRGTYYLVNRTSQPIDSIHLATNPDVPPVQITFDRSVRAVVQDTALGFAIERLDDPLQPGDSMRMEFHAHVEPHGFRQSGVAAAVVRNGTYFTNSWLPSIGYDTGRELSSAGDRRAYGLPAQPVVPSLYSAVANSGARGGTMLDVVIGTSEDQIAIAPGALRRSWTENARRYFHYATDAPIGDEWTFLSARYAIREAVWKNPDGSGRDVTIQVFHAPSDTSHIERMLRGIRASLDFYTSHYGPYDYRHITVVEQPGDGTGLHAEDGFITHSEGFALWKPADEPGALDFPFAVIGHEMGHQWAAPYAFVEGAPVMSEGLAWYYAIEMVRHTRGEQQMQELLHFMRGSNPVAPIHRGEPLLRGLDPYMSYRRAPFALRALADYIGEDRVNASLRNLRAAHTAPGSPLVTTLDLYAELSRAAPDSMRYLLHDLFEVNTTWELTAEHATATQTSSGAWQIALDVTARKIVTDSMGGESAVEMDENVPIGAFAIAPEGAGELTVPVYAAMHRVHTGRQTIRFTVASRPRLVGIDPMHVLDIEEQEDDDNIVGVAVQKAQ